MSHKVKKSKKGDKIITLLILLGIAILILFVIKYEQKGSKIDAAQTSGASLTIDAATTTVDVGATMDVNVLINTGGAQTLSTDAYILYTGTNLQVQSIDNGNFFPAVTSSTSTNSIVIRGMINEPAAYREGSGTLAVIKFKGIRQGTSTLSFYCNSEAGDTSKVIDNHIDAQNILDCNTGNTVTITVGTPDGTTTISASPTPSDLSPTGKPTPTKKPNERELKTIIAMIIIIILILMIILGI